MSEFNYIQEEKEDKESVTLKKVRIEDQKDKEHEKVDLSVTGSIVVEKSLTVTDKITVGQTCIIETPPEKPARVEIKGDLSVTGKINIGQTCIIETPQEKPTKVEIKGDLSVTGAINEGQTAYQVLPQGVIMMWYGDVGKIPAGWAICDGKDNKTPDLRGRFVIGADEQFVYKSSGGNLSMIRGKSIAGLGLDMSKPDCVTEVEYPPYYALYYIMKL